MKAAIRTEYGGPVHLADVAEPTLGRQEVLVAVHCAGLDRGVLHLAHGTPYALRLVFGLRRPKRPVLGLDLAGTVRAVGPEVTRWKVGDEVLGIGRGSFAQLCAAPQTKLVSRPATLTWEEAAALPVSGLTALQALDMGDVGADTRVLVVGASGGVGTLVVQLAAARGAHVTGVCSSSKADRVLTLGASEVVDYRSATLPTGFDVVLAIGGNATVAELRRCLKPKGVLVVIGGEGGEQILGISRQIRAVALNPFVSQRLGMLVSQESGEVMQRLVDSGVRPVVGARYPLDQTAAALADMQAGRVFGKAVIDVWGRKPGNVGTEAQSRSE